MAELGPTPGRVQHAQIVGQAIRVYLKPSLVGVKRVGVRAKGKPVKTQIIRKSGVNRQSTAVIARNALLEKLKDTDKTPADLCAGTRPYEKWLECLSDKMAALS